MHKGLKIAIILAVPTLAVAGLGIWAASIWVDYPWASRKLDATVAESRKLGLPWVASDLDPHPSIPDTENAGPELMKACRIIGSGKLSVRKAQAEFKKGDPTLVRQCLSQYGMAIRAAESASSKPRCHIERDYDLGPNLLLPEYSRWKDIVTLLSIRAQMRSKSGDLAGTLSDIRTMGAIAKQAGADPLLIGMLVQVAMESIRVRSVESIAANWKSDPAKLERLRQATEKQRPETDFVGALRGEVYMAIALFRNWEAFGGVRFLAGPEGSLPEVDPTKIQRDGMPKGMVARGYLTRSLEYWNAVFESIRDGLNDPVQLSKRMDQLAARFEKLPGLSYKPNAILMPVFGQAGIACARMDALQRATDAFLRVMVFRAKNGEYPSSLEDLGFREVDPFSNQPFHYSHASSSCRIYSVGTDGRDDGGVTRAERARGKQTSDRYDEAIAYPPIKL